MKNYTTQTAALKAVTVDTHSLDVNRIDAKKIFINGEELNNVSTEVVNYLWSDLQKTTVDDYVVLKCETEEGAYPIHLYINGILVMCQNNKTLLGWEWYICPTSDNLSEIYGGITDDTPVSIVFKFAASTNGGGGSLPLNNDYIMFDETGVVINAQLLNKTTLHMTCYNVNQKSWDWDLPNVTSMDSTFWKTPMTEWNIELPKVTTLNGTFAYSKIIEWNTQLPSITSMGSTFSFSSLKKINISLDTLVTGTSPFRNCSITEWNINLPNLTNGSDFIRNTSIVSFTGNLDSLSNGYDFFWSCPKFTTFNSALPKLDNGVDMFGGTILNKESAIRVLETIPTYTSGSHGLMIGIHIDHKYDPDVQLALKRASVKYNPTNTLPIDPETGEPFVVETGKGWTLTVQWNGTKTENAYPAPASVATYGLRRPTIITEDTTVYAKLVSTSEETKLIWGHFVENWEEEGYQEFENLEAAQAYFNI